MPRLTGPLLPLVVLLALAAAMSAVQPAFFLTPGNLSLLADESSVILLLATGQTLVILLGGIDLSMAALAALVSVLIALGLPSMGAGAVPAALALGTLLGAAQGMVHARAQLPSVIVTLAGLGLWSGIALAIAHTTVPISDGYAAIGWLEGSSYGVPHPFVFAATALGVLAALMRYLPFGRAVYAIGLNPRVAILSGIRVAKVKILAFALSGLFAGLAGMTLAARTYSGNPSIADNLLLPSIAAVLIGGTAMTGGLGGFMGTLVGVLTVTLLRIGIAATGIDPAYEPIIYGLLVVAAVALSADRSTILAVK
jgi:ribose transport system permease protein